MNNPQLARERAVYDYLESLENGDIDGIIQSLLQAIHDAQLDQMLVDAHQAYFQEEQTQLGPLADIAIRTDLPLRRPAPPHARIKPQKRCGSPRWAPALAAVLLVGSFVALLMWRQAASNVTRPTTPLSSACTALKLYPAPGHGNMDADLLSAVTVVAPRDAWAVGYSVVPQVSLAPERTLIEHWNGQRWQIAASPNGKTENNVLPDNGILNAVAVVSAKNIWAAGYYQARKSGQGELDSNTLIEHWNGVDWQVVPSPNSSSGNGRLNAVAAISANDVWAAGQATLSDGKTQLPLLEHWDGKQWSVVSSFPRMGSTVLNGLAVVSARDIWVAGGNFISPTTQGLLAHWDGSQWKLFPFPSVYSFGQLSARTPDDIWALGTSLASGSSLVEHWDGQRWSVMPLPQLASAADYTVYLSGIAVVTANDVWTVGYLRVSGQEEQFLVLHWNGKTWQRVKIQVSQPQAHNEANAIAIGYNQTWIVGDTEGHTALLQGCA